MRSPAPLLGGPARSCSPKVKVPIHPQGGAPPGPYPGPRGPRQGAGWLQSTRLTCREEAGYRAQSQGEDTYGPGEGEEVAFRSPRKAIRPRDAVAMGISRRSVHSRGGEEWPSRPLAGGQETHG